VTVNKATLLIALTMLALFLAKAQAFFGVHDGR
jgi:hypothetical protein